jgi:iron(III) transport system ATP-binding protein
MAELRCSGVAKAYGAREVLRDVDLVVPAGTLTAILGASGSGKTTLLRLVIGFIAPDRGSISVGGTPVAEARRLHVAPERRAVGYVAQEGALFPHLSVAENIAFGLPRRERRDAARVSAMLELVGLPTAYASRRPHELSGGEQRRVGLARALAPRPRLILLDEPFSGLDAHLRAETRAAVTHALAAEGATAVLVTHDQAEALSMGREVAVLRSGRLAQTAAPEDLYRRPVDLDVARFVGEAIVLPGHASAGLVECALGRLPATGEAPDGEVAVLLRPEQLRLSRAPAESTGAAEVLGATYYGPEIVVRLALADAKRTEVTARTHELEPPTTGASVRIDVVGPVVVYALEAQSARRQQHGEAR